jgi:hypothetical protein
MDTLPRFRLPDESSSRSVSKVARVLDAPSFLENEFDDIAPTIVRPARGLHVLGKNELGKSVHAKTANVDDVVEELRAAASGRKARVRELDSEDLLEGDGADDSAEQVDVGDLVFDRAVPARAVWNVRQAARPTQHTIIGPTEAPGRFLATAALAMFVGACLAIAAALILWRVTGFQLH